MASPFETTTAQQLVCQDLSGEGKTSHFLGVNPVVPDGGGGASLAFFNGLG